MNSGSEPEYETVPGYTEIYRTKFGPAVKTEINSASDTPGFTVVSALLSEMEQHGGMEALLEQKDYDAEKLEQAVEFAEEEEFRDLYSELESRGFADP